MKKTPIKIFKTEKDLLDCASYWIRQLQLESWKLKFYLVTKEEMPLQDSFGCIKMVYESNAAAIYIISDPENVEDSVFDFCAEQTLVHELLHLRYNLFCKQDPSLTELFYDTEEHRKLDQLSIILVATKYDILPCEV